MVTMVNLTHPRRQCCVNTVICHNVLSQGRQSYVGRWLWAARWCCGPTEEACSFILGVNFFASIARKKWKIRRLGEMVNVISCPTERHQTYERSLLKRFHNVLPVFFCVEKMVIQASYYNKKSLLSKWTFLSIPYWNLTASMNLYVPKSVLE